MDSKINWTVPKLNIQPEPLLVKITPKIRVPANWTLEQREKFLKGYNGIL